MKMKTIEDYKQAAIRGGADEVHAKFYEDGKELGIAVKSNEKTSALRLMLAGNDDATIMADIESFAKEWAAKSATGAAL